MKHLLSLTAAVIALLLSSCSNNEEVAQSTETPDAPVSFVPYMVNRATDVIDTEGLKTRGFGVFAYMQGTLGFAQYYPVSSIPNFMNNQLVTYNPVSTFWEYTPLKYWSNTPLDRHSYFAYAPYYQEDGTTRVLKNYPYSPGLVLDGVNEGPAIYYEIPTDVTKVIDLCWGDYNYTGHAALDLLKPETAERIHFTFRHSLSQVTFNVQIWTDEIPDPNKNHETEGTPSAPLDPNTKITVKSIKLVGSIARSGHLCLSNGRWNATYDNHTEVNLAENFKKGSTACPGAYELDNVVEEQPLFGTEDDYYTAIPGSSYQILVEYDVETTDSNIEGGKVVMPNKRLSKEAFTMDAGKAYHFHLNLGMNSVKVEADVAEWAVTPEYKEVYVPANE